MGMGQSGSSRGSLHLVWGVNGGPGARSIWGLKGTLVLRLGKRTVSCSFEWGERKGRRPAPCLQELKSQDLGSACSVAKP